MEGREAIERWIANGFWYLEKCAAEWAGHPNRIEPRQEAYNQAANRRLGDLAHWLLFGECRYEGSGPLPPI
jgi:hypothetical protein